MVQDACQTAWTALLRREDVPLDNDGFSWLCKVARTTGRRTAISREIPAGGFLPSSNDRDQPVELPEPPGHAPDPADRVVERERYRERREQLAQLTPRERQFALQAIGLSCDEIAEREQVSSCAVPTPIRTRGGSRAPPWSPRSC